MNEFPYKLSAINRMLRAEMLPEIKKQHVLKMINQTRPRLKINEHYRKEQRGKYNIYFYSNIAVVFFRDWAIKRREKLQSKQREDKIIQKKTKTKLKKYLTKVFFVIF